MLSSHGLKSCSSNSVNNPPERPEFVLRVSNVNKNVQNWQDTHWTIGPFALRNELKKSYIQFWFIAPHHLILSQDGSAHVSIWTMNKLGVLIACSSCGNQPTELTTDQKLLIGPPVDCCLIWKENRRNQRSQRFESFVLVLLVTDGLQKSSSMGVVWLCTFLLMHESIDLVSILFYLWNRWLLVILCFYLRGDEKDPPKDTIYTRSWHKMNEYQLQYPAILA